MAEPTQGELYSLLGEVTASSFQNKAEEERKLRRDLKKSQVKAMLLQPLIGAAATTGIEALTDLAGKAFLSDQGRSFANTEAGKALGVQLRSIEQQKDQVKAELDFYNAPDASTKMAELIYNEQIAKLGKLNDTEQGQIKSLIYNDKELISNELNAYRTALKNQLKLLNTAPSLEQIKTRLANPKFYYGKTKLQKLFSTGFNKLLGKDMEEIKQRARNFLITGSEDPEYKSKIFEYMNDSKAFQELEKNSNKIITGDETFIKNYTERLKTDPDSAELFNAISSRHKRDADKAVAAHVFFKSLTDRISLSQQKAKEMGTINPLADTLVYKAFTSPDAQQFIDNNDIKGFKNFVLKNFFEGPNKDQTFEDFTTSSLANSSVIAKAQEDLGQLLKQINPRVAKKVAGEQKYFEDLTKGAFKDAEKAIYILGYENPEAGNYTPTEVRQGIRRYVAARLTNPNVNEDFDYRPVTLKELTDEESTKLLEDSIALAKKNIDLTQRNKEFEEQAYSDISTKINSIIENISNDPTIDDNQKYQIATDTLKTFTDNFKNLNFSAEYEDQFNAAIIKVAGDIETTFTARPPTGRVAGKTKPTIDIDKFLKENLSLFPQGRGRQSPVLQQRSLLAKATSDAVKDKVTAVGELFGDSPSEILFMQRLVNQESLLGKAPGTYDFSGKVGSRGSFGVAQVDEVAFNAVKDKLKNPYSTISKYVEPFKQTFGKDLTTVNYEDLEDDTLSIAFGRLYLMQLTGEPIPSTKEDQAKYWKRHYNTSAGKGTVDEFLDTNKNL